MAYPNINNLLSNAKPATIKRVFVKNATEKWQYLGQIRNGELKVMPYVTENTVKNNLHINSFSFEAKFELLQTAVAEMDILASLFGGVSGVANDFLLELAERSGAFPTTSTATAGFIQVSGTSVRPKGKYVADGNPSTNQFVEVTLMGTIFSSDANMVSLFTPSVDDGEFHLLATGVETFVPSTGVFGDYTLCAGATSAHLVTGIPANIRPNGIASVALDNPLSSGAETLSNVKNGKITCEFLSDDDTLGRPNVYGVDVMVEYESLISDSSTSTVLSAINNVNTDVVVTMLDGKVFTLNSKLGVQASFEDVGDFDKFRIVRFTHKGRIPLSEFAGIVA